MESGLGQISRGTTMINPRMQKKCNEGYKHFSCHGFSNQKRQIFNTKSIMLWEINSLCPTPNKKVPNSEKDKLLYVLSVEGGSTSEGGVLLVDGHWGSDWIIVWEGRGLSEGLTILKVNILLKKFQSSIFLNSSFL